MGKFWEKLGKIREKGKRDFGGIFRVFGCRRDFRDGGDGAAGRPADRGKPRIPGEVADSGAGAARGERRWPERWRAVPARFAARA
jgi:hypothetical protein